MDFSHQPQECLAGPASLAAYTGLLKTLAKLKNLRRAAGPQGRIKRIILDDILHYMDPLQSRVFPFPTTMKLHFDDYDDAEVEAEKTTVE